METIGLQTTHVKLQRRFSIPDTDNFVQVRP